MREVITQALQEYVPEDEGNPFAAWAGECGLFLDFACRIADQRGVPYVIGNAYNGALDGGFDLVPPPGLTLNDLHAYGIVRSLNHIWLIHDGRHFDASTAEGANDLFGLRIVRQVAVEMLRRRAPARLAELSAVHEYWLTSERLLDEYLAILSPGNTKIANLRTPGP